MIDLATAKALSQAMESKAAEIGVPVVIAVADAGGYLIALERMDDAPLGSIDIAINKAYTSVLSKMETSTFGRLGQPGGPLFGINTLNNGRVVLFGGGFPLFRGRRLVGAIGVSGGSVEEDELIAGAGLTFFNE